MEIYVACELEARELQHLRDHIAGDTLHLRNREPLSSAPGDSFARCEVVFGNPPPAWLTQTSLLRWVQLDSVGFGEYAVLDWASLRQRITMTNLPGFFTEPVAESALSGILALCRGTERLVRLQNERRWCGEALRRELRMLAGAEVVLFGYGDINRRLAALLEPFGCRITHFGSDWQDRDLDAALSRADVLVAVVPETPATIGVFDERRLSLLPHAALFVNFGRGSVVDEGALVRLLERGHLGGAVVDVTREEPLPVQHPLWACPNTIVTQHTGGGTFDEMVRKIEVFGANLERYRRGVALAGVVDFERGY